MQIIQISEVYSVHEVKYASELLYICELAKEFHRRGYQLSIDGVILANVLRKSRYWAMFRVAVSMGWLVNATFDGADDVLITPANPIEFKEVYNIYVCEEPVEMSMKEINKRSKDYHYACVTPEKCHVIFKKNSTQTGEEWVWTFSGVVQNGMSQRIIAAVAYVAVERLFAERNITLKVYVPLEFVDKYLCLVDFIVLQERTNALDNWARLEYDKLIPIASQKTKSYEAWWHIGREMGYLARVYTDAEKRAYMKKRNIEVGDILTLYERNQKPANNLIKSIKQGWFCIITAITTKGITVEKVITNATKYTRELEFKKLKTAEKEIFKGHYRTDLYSGEIQEIPWEDIGIEYCMRTEKYFIAPIQADSVTTIPMLSKITNKTVMVEMDAFDFIYFLLKDYSKSFDEKRFLNKYFTKRIPVWVRYENEEI